MPDLSQTQPFAFTCEGGLVKSRSTFYYETRTGVRAIKL